MGLACAFERAEAKKGVETFTKAEIDECRFQIVGKSFDRLRMGVKAIAFDHDTN